MATPYALLLSTSVVAIPAVSVGAYYLSSSGNSTSEEPVKKQEQPTIPLENIKEPLREESATDSDIEQGITLVPEERVASDFSDLLRELLIKEEKSIMIGNTKSLISHILGTFPYDRIDSQDEKSDRIETFVRETDEIRDLLHESVTKNLLDQEEYKNQNIKEIIKSVTDFKPIEKEEDTIWSKLAQIRKDEVLTQFSLDSEKNPTTESPTVNEETKESIKRFCEDPSESNSHLGMHSPTRIDKEIRKEYRFFTYYSYCTKESFYLSSKLVFEK